MKKLALLITVALLLCSVTGFSYAEEAVTYTQAPMFDQAVADGTLPPVEERLPEEPCICKEMLDEHLDQQIGNYGGTLRTVTSSVNWDADVFIGMCEAFLLMESTNSSIITPNVVKDYTVNEDCTEFTFTLRKGMKWSDGVEVTMDDVRFGIENYVFNEELTPSVAAWMRAGGTDVGDPFTFEVVDDETFKISFAEPYSGFLLHISIVGYKGYSALMKPAHFLKPFHKDFAEECHGSLDAYYEFIQPYATAMGYDDASAEGVWCYVFNQLDCTEWECTDPDDAMPNHLFTEIEDCPTSFPTLYPWIMTSCDNGVTIWERNPYYFRVDAAGQQLPYFDYVSSTYVENAETVQLSAIAGDVDFMRESATINNISLYRENAETANITAYTAGRNNTTGDIHVNHAFGLNTDGTVKDDDESKAWQEMVSDNRFLQALVSSIDANEMIDTVFMDFAKPNEFFNCAGDVDYANGLLDEMGALDVDGDGWRETPSGLQLTLNLFSRTGGSYTDVLACAELYCEYFGAIGLRTQVQPIDSTLLDTRINANEIALYVLWTGAQNLWYGDAWGYNQPLWEAWLSAGGLRGDVDDNSTEYLKPSDEWIEYRTLYNKRYQVDAETAVSEVVPAMRKLNAENVWYISAVEDVQQCVVINSDIGNVPTGGVGIGWNFAISQMYYLNPDQH